MRNVMMQGVGRVLCASVIGFGLILCVRAVDVAYPQYAVDVAGGDSVALRQVKGITRVAAAGATGEVVSYVDFRAMATSGSLLKTGDGTLTIDEAIAGFDGQVHVMKGVLVACCSNALGKTSHQTTPKESERAYVHQGATLVMDDPQASLVRQEANAIYFEGDGVPGLGGALVTRNGNRAGGSTYWPFGVCSRPTGPARIYIDAPVGAQIGVTYAAGGARSSSLDLQGEEVLLCGREPESVFLVNAAQVTGIGRLSVSNVTLTLSGNSAALVPKANVDSEVRFQVGSRWRWNKSTNLSFNEQRQKARLVVDGMEAMVMAQGKGNPLAVGVDPFVAEGGYTNCVWWCGPVVLNTDLRLYNEYSPVCSKSTKLEQGFSFTNTVSGAGGIRPAVGSDGKSWGQGITVNLMSPNNSFTGGIVLDQSTLAVWRNGAVPAQENAGPVSITNGCVKFCKLPTAHAWDEFAMPDVEFVGSCVVTNGSGRWRSVVKKGAGTLDYNSQMGGGTLDVQEGAVAFHMGQCPTFDTIRFGEGSVVALEGMATLPAGKREYTIAAADQIIGSPTLALTPSTEGWELVKRANALVLRSNKRFGFVFLLRSEPVVPPKPVTYRTVTFRRLNGTVLQRVAVADGSSVSALTGPEEPNMRFVGWDRVERLSHVTENVDVWALYEAETDLEPSTSIASKSVASRTTPYSLEEYFQLYDHLAWSDEFSGTELNRGKKKNIWSSTYTGGNWNYDMEQRNGELHKHAEDCAIVADGCLRLRTQRKANGSYQFESGGVKSNGKVAFKYGRCEIRAKLCRGLGVWPAFWFMGSKDGWPKCGEIDAMEQMNGGAWMASTLHIPNAAGNGTIQTQATCGPTDGVHWGDGFHRIGVIVNEREVVFYTDDMIHERIDISDSRYSMLRDRSQYMLLGSGMGGAWSGITDAAQVPATFQSEDYVIDYCRIYVNETEGRTLAREAAVAELSAPVSATAWKGWSMSWGKSGAGAYQNDISTNGFTEAFYVDCAVNGHVARDRPDVVLFLTDPACMTGADSGAKNFWTNLQLNVEGMLVARPKRLADGQHEALCATVMYDGRRFSAVDSICSTLPFASTGFTNATAVCAELVERSTGAKVMVMGVNLAAASTAAELAPVVSWMESHRTENVLVFFQGMTSDAYQSVKSLAGSLDPAYGFLGEDASGYRRAYATAAGNATKPEKLTIVNPARPARVSMHTMQALQATVGF